MTDRHIFNRAYEVLEDSVLPGICKLIGKQIGEWAYSKAQTKVCGEQEEFDIKGIQQYKEVSKLIINEYIDAMFKIYTFIDFSECLDEKNLEQKRYSREDIEKLLKIIKE